MTKPDTDRDFMDAAFDVARRFRAFDSYDANPATAIRALVKRSQGRDRESCEKAFEMCIAVYEAALEVVKRHSGALWDEHKATKEFPDMAPYDEAMQALVSQVEPELAREAMTWVFYWHHLR